MSPLLAIPIRYVMTKYSAYSVYNTLINDSYFSMSSFNISIKTITCLRCVIQHFERPLILQMSLFHPFIQRRFSSGKSNCEIPVYSLIAHWTTTIDSRQWYCTLRPLVKRGVLRNDLCLVAAHLCDQWTGQPSSFSLPINCYWLYSIDQLRLFCHCLFISVSFSLAVFVPIQNAPSKITDDAIFDRYLFPQTCAAVLVFASLYCIFPSCIWSVCKCPSVHRNWCSAEQCIISLPKMLRFSVLFASFFFCIYFPPCFCATWLPKQSLIFPSLSFSNWKWKTRYFCWLSFEKNRCQKKHYICFSNVTCLFFEFLFVMINRLSSKFTDE